MQQLHLVSVLLFLIAAARGDASSSSASSRSSGRRRRVGAMTMLAFDEPSASEATLARHWYFTRKINQPVPINEIEKPLEAPIRSILSPKLVHLNEDRTVDLGNGEVGIWNYKPDKKMIEMEFDLKNDDSTYLLYQAQLKQGQYYKQVVKFGDEGKIYLVKGLPFKWNKKLIGTFKGSPVGLPKPSVNMKRG